MHRGTETEIIGDTEIRGTVRIYSFTVAHNHTAEHTPHDGPKGSVCFINLLHTTTTTQHKSMY